MRSDPVFALRSRTRCAPVECTKRDGCWVISGKASNLLSVGSPLCTCCNGRILFENWISPGFEKREMQKSAQQ
jgi:hypothetical protein